MFFTHSFWVLRSLRLPQLTLHTLVNIYNSLITLYLHYGLTVWGQASKTQLNKLLILQKRALRFIYFSDRRNHAIPLFLNAHILPGAILPISFMHYKLLVKTMHDLSNDLAPSNPKDPFAHEPRSLGISISRNQILKLRGSPLQDWCKTVEWDTNQVKGTP